MKERPILFSGAMVRAILDGRKTQTRRPVKGWPLEWLQPGNFMPEYVADPENHACPYGQPGDRLWVRETFAHIYRSNTVPEARSNEDVVYAADGFSPDEYVYGSWKPSIHMPRWAARIMLEITNVRAERLQDISDEDVDAECFGGDYPEKVLPELFPRRDEGWGHLSMPECFARLWESVNGAGSWDANPWVWVVECRKV